MAQRFNVRAFRDKHGLSAQRVADHVGVHVRTVKRWSAGEADPSPLALKKLQELKAKHEPATSDEHDDDAPMSPPPGVSAKPRRHALLPSIR